MRNRNEYPENWEDTIRPAILKRDNYKCTDCNIVHRSDYYLEAGRVVSLLDELMVKWAQDRGKRIKRIFLQIAHLDGDPGNNDFKNLKAKCPRCHLNYDKEMNRLKRISKVAGR